MAGVIRSEQSGSAEHAEMNHRMIDLDAKIQAMINEGAKRPEKALSLVPGNTAILLQYFIVITTQSRCKIPGHYSAQGLTILSTRLKGGCFGGI